MRNEHPIEGVGVIIYSDEMSPPFCAVNLQGVALGRYLTREKAERVLRRMAKRPKAPPGIRVTPDGFYEQTPPTVAPDLVPEQGAGLAVAAKGSEEDEDADPGVGGTAWMGKDWERQLERLERATSASQTWSTEDPAPVAGTLEEDPRVARVIEAATQRLEAIFEAPPRTLGDVARKHTGPVGEVAAARRVVQGLVEQRRRLADAVDDLKALVVDGTDMLEAFDRMIAVTREPP